MTLGKQYPKLDSYVLLMDGEWSYLGSSTRFKTKKEYKAWIRENITCMEEATLAILKSKEA